jgi:glycosyltransferase involved in cell wall biosynthesis
MRIVYVSSNLGVHDFRFLKKLSGSEHKVFLITHYPHKELPSEITVLKSIEIIHYNNPLAFGDGAEKYSILTRKIRCWLAFIRSFFRFKRDIRKIKPDLIHAGWVQNDGFLAAASGYHPLLLMPWGSDLLINPQMSISLMFKTKFVLSKADMITCDCESVKRKILELIPFPPEKIVVFPWGVDLTLFRQNLNGNLMRKQLEWEKNKILLMIRSFSQIYGVEYFLHALPKIIKECPDVRIILCGDGPLRIRFQEIVKDYGIGDYVYFAGLIKNEELPSYFSAADIYISSSLSDGTSLSLLEAMACGLPVIVPDVSSYFEWINNNENGFVIPRKDSNQLALKIIQLLNDEDKCRKFGQRNFEIAQARANWDRNFEKLEYIYSSLANKSS